MSYPKNANIFKVTDKEFREKTFEFIGGLIKQNGITEDCLKVLSILNIVALAIAWIALIIALNA